MAEDLQLPPPMRLMNFVSQEQLEETKRSRGERVEDGTAQRDRPLFAILKENKDKQDAEFNERFKHRPPKALDEDETEFLDKLETSRKEYERQIANEEAQQLQMFQAAVVAQSTSICEIKETPLVSVSDVQEKRTLGKKIQPAQPLGMIIKVKPLAKKAKVDPSLGSGAVEKPFVEVPKCLSLQNTCTEEEKPNEPSLSPNTNEGNIYGVPKTGLVLYSDESD